MPTGGPCSQPQVRPAPLIEYRTGVVIGIWPSPTTRPSISRRPTPLKSPLLSNENASSCSPDGTTTSDVTVYRSLPTKLCTNRSFPSSRWNDHPPSTVPIASSTPSVVPTSGRSTCAVMVWFRLRTFTVTFSGIGAPYGQKT